MITRRRFSSVLLAATVVVLSSCGASVTNTLQLVIAAAEAALGVLGITAYAGWLKAVSEAVSFASTELASSDSSVVKAEKIITQFALIAAPILPPGTAQEVVNAIEAVVTAIGTFLSSIQPAAPAPSQARVAGITGKTSKPVAVPKQIKLSTADQQILLQIKSRADSLASKIK